MSFIINIKKDAEDNINLSAEQKAILIQFLDKHNTLKCVVETEDRLANVVNINLNKDYTARPKVVNINSLEPDEVTVISNLFSDI